MLTPFWQVPFHAFSELAGSGFLDLQCDDAGEPDRPDTVVGASRVLPVAGDAAKARVRFLGWARPVRHD